jgi:tetratricopeptide (TPR) repeat protein
VAPASTQAYREFLSGYYAAWNARKDANLQSYYKAVSHLERALELEPGYADAHATLAGILAYRFFPWTGEGPKFLAGAEGHARAALERAPRNSDALAALARCLLQRRDLPGAMGLANRAVAAEPGNADALSSLAEVYTAMGFHESALEAYRRAAKRTFLGVEPFTIGSMLAMNLGRLDEAEQLLKSHGSVDPESVMVHSTRGLLLSCRGEHAKAEAIEREVVRTLLARQSPEAEKRVIYSFAPLNLALVLVRQNRRQEALEVVGQLPPPMARRVPVEIQVRAALEQHAEAFQLLENSVLFRNYRFLVTEPSLQPLYGTSRFRRLVESTYPQWEELTRQFAAGALIKPPALPGPAEFFAGKRVAGS